MKYVLAAAAIVMSTLGTQPALAAEGGSCHFHGNKPAAEATILGCAQQRKEFLVKTGKLDATWMALKHDKIEAVDGKKGKEWKVSFKDPGAKDKSKETLFIFFTVAGNFIAANYTGQ